MKPAKETPTNEAAKPKRVIHGGWVAVGAIVSLMSVGCIGIEIVRNYVFGARGVHGEIDAIIAGGSVAIFAVLLLMLPLIASRYGWNLPLRGLWLFSMTVTAYCGLAYYVDDIRAKARDAQQITRKFEDARRDLADAERERDDARAEMRRAQAAADAIEENAPSSELQALADQADQKARAEATDQKRGAKCGDICRAAEREADEYRRRKPDAVAKEAALARIDAARKRAERAQARVDLAKADANTGPAEASGMAGLAEDMVGINAAVYESWEGLATPIAKVIGMLGGASLLDRGLALLLFGLGCGAVGRKIEVEAIDLKVVPPPAKPGFAQRAASLIAPPKGDGAKRGRKPMTPEERIMQFAEERLRPGEGEAFAGEIGEAFTEWWRVKCPGQRTPSQNTLSDVLTGQAGIAKERRGGRVRYAAALI